MTLEIVRNEPSGDDLYFGRTVAPQITFRKRMYGIVKWGLFGMTCCGVMYTGWKVYRFTLTEGPFEAADFSVGAIGTCFTGFGGLLLRKLDPYHQLEQATKELHETTEALRQTTIKVTASTGVLASSTQELETGTKELNTHVQEEIVLLETLKEELQRTQQLQASRPPLENNLGNSDATLVNPKIKEAKEFYNLIDFDDL